MRWNVSRLIRVRTVKTRSNSRKYFGVGIGAIFGCSIIVFQNCSGFKASSLTSNAIGLLTTVPVERISQFLVASIGNAPDPTTIPEKAPRIDFIWSAAMSPSEWRKGNSKIDLGLYTQLNGANNAGVRCIPDSNPDNNPCILPGYTCGQQGYHPLLLPVQGENVCYQDGNKQQRICTSADQGNDCNCSSGKCWLSMDQMRRIEYFYWSTLHPSWILYREDPTSVPSSERYLKASWDGDGLPLYLDFTNPEVQDELLRRIKSQYNLYGQKNQQYNPNGELPTTLSVDVVFAMNYYGAKGALDESGQFLQKFSGDQAYDPLRCAQSGLPGYCDEVYTAGVVSWLERLSTEAHNIGLKLAINFVYRGLGNLISPGDATMKRIISYADSIFDESGGFTAWYNRQVTNPQNTAVQCYTRLYDSNALYQSLATCPAQPTYGIVGKRASSLWSNYAYWLAFADRMNKPYYTKTGFAPYPGDSPVAPPPRMLQGDTNAVFASDEEVEWALASYLLVKGNLTSLYISRSSSSSVGDAATAPLYRQFDLDLGWSCGSRRTIAPFTYLKVFNHAIAIANTGTSMSGQQTLDLSGSLPTVSASNPGFFEWNRQDQKYSQAVSGKVSVDYQQGLVLYSPDSLCPEFDDARKLDLAEIAQALEAYYSANGTYLVTGAGATGQGFFAYEDGLAYKDSIGRVLFEQGYLDNPDIEDPKQFPGYMLYLCDNAQTYSLFATLDRPTPDDLANARVGCNGTGSNGAVTVYGKNYSLNKSHAR